MFRTSLNISDIDCDQKSLIYTFECDVKIKDKIVTLVKVGQTLHTIKTRLSNYREENIKNIYWLQVEDCVTFEKKLLEHLKNDLKLEILKGREFFSTNIETVKQAILKVYTSLNDNEEKTPINYKFQCEHCQKGFKCKSGLATHISFCKDKENKPKEQFICDFCDKEFVTKRILKNHYLTCKEKEIEDIKQHYNSIIENFEIQIVEIKQTSNTVIEKLQMQINNLTEKLSLTLKDENKYI
jgi:hypothetical protein